MTHWNYRILANITQHYVEYKICEVYYGNDNVPNGYSDVVSLSGEDLESIEYILKKAKRAFKEPILYYGDKFPMEYEK